MAFFAVYLASKRFIVIKRQWIKNPVVGKPSKVFLSPNINAVPIFNDRPRYYLNTKVNACYDAFIFKAFGELK